MSVRSNVLSFVVGVALIVAPFYSGSAHAATSTWDGGAGSVAGTVNTGLVSQQSINYYVWDTAALNWSGATPFALNDDAVFNSASGTFPIRVSATTLDPKSLAFTGGATYDFLRASTNTSGSSNYAGWYSTGYAPAAANIAGADSFGSSALTDANPLAYATTTGSITLGTTAGTGFTGSVILRVRPVAFPSFTGTHTVHAGTLEIHDGGALVAANQNTPSLTLDGGTFAVNIDTGSYTYRQGNTSTAGAQLGGTLTVTANSNLSNTAVDIYGRAREQNQIWNGSINVGASQTLTVNTGGGTTIGGASGSAFSGTGTVKIGTDAATGAGNNRLRVLGALATGANTITFDLGTSGILENNVAAGATANFGSVVSASGTLIRGSSSAGGATTAAAATLATSSATVSIGNAGASDTINGVIANGSASNTGGGVTPGVTRLDARAVLNTNVTKVGAGTLTLNGSNVYNGATTVAASGGKIVVGNTHALGDGSELVTVNSGGTLDVNGKNQVAGKVYSLNGGSLVNDNTSTAAKLSSGASVSLRANTAGAGGNGGTGAWKGGDAASQNLNAGQTPTVGVSAPNTGSDQATAHVVMQLGWLRFNVTDGGAAGSGYITEPKISFSAPDLDAAHGGRPIKAVAILSAATGATAGTVSGVTITDPGFGYTSIPTITIDNTGTGGTGFAPAWSMTAGSVLMDNGGSGYTSTPAFTFGGTGYVASSTNPFGGYGQVQLAASSSSNIGGAGDLTVDAQVTGSGNLSKVGNGTTNMTGTNNYSGTTTVSAGTLRVNGAHTGGGAYTVSGGATLGGAGTIGSSVTVSDDGILQPGNSIGTLTINNSVVLNPASQLAMELTGSDTTPGSGINDLITGVTALTLDGTVNVTPVGSFLSAAAGTKWRLINYSGTLTDNGLAVGSMPTLSTGLYFAIETAIAGQVNLIVQVPETGAFLSVGLVALVCASVVTMRRRRVSQGVAA